jgi:hypothetical protein
MSPITWLKLISSGVGSENCRLQWVFFDLKSAFYSVLRQALLSDQLDPRPVAAALHSWGIPTQLIDMWLKQANSDHAILNASAHTEKLI